MYDDILVPTDGGESVEQVLEHTMEVADGRDATVHVLYVVDDRAFLTLDEDVQSDVVADLQREGEVALDEASEHLEAAGFEVEMALRQGTPADEIVAYVAEAGVDLVTMGTQADKYEKNMLGSTTQKVVTQSTAPVLAVDIS